MTDDPSGIAARLIRLAQQFEDQHAPQDMTLLLREAAAEIELGRTALREVYEEGLVNQGGAYKIGFYKCFKIARRALRIPHMSFDAARAALDDRT